MEYEFTNYTRERITKLKNALDDNSRWLKENGIWYTIFVPPIAGDVIVDRETFIKHIQELEQVEEKKTKERYDKLLKAIERLIEKEKVEEKDNKIIKAIGRYIE